MTYVADPSTPVAKPGPRLAVGIIVMVIGAIATVAGGIGIGTKVAHVFTGQEYVSPGVVHRSLTSGTWQVYEGVRSDTDETPLVGSGLSPSDVTVTGPDGQTLETFVPSATETLGVHSTQYLGVVEFKVRSDGDYDIDVEGVSGEPFYVSESFGEVAKRAVGWAILLAAGILIGIVGFVLLIVGIVRRSRAKRALAGPYGGYPQPAYAPAAPVPPMAGDPAATPAPAANLPAPGWYPDPQIPGTQRWWDGTRWTDQTQNS